MTLPSSGPMSIAQVAAEFSLPSNTPFPTGFYGKAGAPASGPLSLSYFYGKSALTADFSIGSQTDTPLGGTGTTRHARVLTGAPTGGTGPYTYAWALSAQSGSQPLSLTSNTANPTTAQSTWADLDPATASATVTLTITDTSNGTTAQVAKVVTLN